MGSLSGQIPSLVGGVSQQAPSVRSASQLEYVENGWLHPALGNTKRPAGELIAGLSTSLSDNAFFHGIVRDSEERYIVVVDGNDIKVFDHKTGKSYTVTHSAGSFDYLTCDNSYEDIRAVTIADSTFIVNRKIKVEMDSELSPGSLTASVQIFSDLPKSATTGNLYGIKGDPATGFDGYYVQKEGTGVWREIAKPGIVHQIDGTTMPHELRRVPDSMNPDGFYFAFGPASWDVRPSGDEKSNANPSFVGECISDVILHRERLGIIAGESVALSEVGYYFNFWRTTVTQLLDSDVIDITIPQNKVLSLQYAIPYQSSLILFGQDSQIQLTGEPYLSPKTAKADGITNYSNSQKVRPVLLGDSLYYVTDEQSHAVVREYFADDVSVTGDAVDVSSHVPVYVPGNLRVMTGATAKDVLFIASNNADDTSQIYLYQFKWTDAKEKLQSAWHRWSIKNTGRVLFMNCIGDTLYVVTKTGTQTELLKFVLSENECHPLVPTIPILLDRMIVVEDGAYNTMGGYTDYSLPVVYSSLVDAQLINTVDSANPGSYANELNTAALVDGGITLRLLGNTSSKRFLFGYNYNHQIGLSEVQVKDSQSLAVLIGRCQVKRMTVAYTNGAYFETIVAPKGRDPLEESYNITRRGHYNARTVGDVDFATSVPIVGSGNHSFLVMSRSNQVDVSLVNPLPYPCWFQSVQWEATFTARSQV